MAAGWGLGRAARTKAGRDPGLRIQFGACTCQARPALRADRLRLQQQAAQVGGEKTRREQW